MNIVDLSPAFFPSPVTGAAISVGFVYVGEPDSDPTLVINQKEIFLLQENGTLVATAQPVTLGAGGLPTYNGSTVTIYVTGDYSIRVDDSSNVQVYYIPRTIAEPDPGSAFPIWDNGTTYSQNEYIVASDSRLYYSIADGNLNHDPASTTGFWQGLVQIGDDVVGDLTGDIKATDGTVVLDNGTDGTDATFTGDVTGDVAGDVTGNVTGDLTGDVTGSINTNPALDATNLQSGFLRIATDAESDAGLSEVIGVNPKQLQDTFTSKLPLGDGQTWQNFPIGVNLVTERDQTLEYQNTSGRTIQLAISGTITPNFIVTIDISTDGASWTTINKDLCFNVATGFCFNVTIPNDIYYRLLAVSSTLSTWFELRE